MSTSKPLSLNRLRLRKFRRLKRGYYSFVLLIGCYAISFFLPLLMNNRALMVSYQGAWSFPAVRSFWHQALGLGDDRIILGKEFGQTQVGGQTVFGEARYRALQQQFREAGEGDWVLMPFVPFGARENFLELEGVPPHAPSGQHWMGTDTAGRDVFVRLAYGFRISISFALLVTVVSYTVGTTIGAILGYFGRWIDIVGLRLVEIWGAIPFLYTVIIISSIFTPNFQWLAGILAAFGWLGISYYVRGEFYREKSKDYVAAAIAVGENHFTIIFRYILPNALTPIIAFAPFAIVGSVAALVSLDFLGFGLQPPTPSWGELLRQAKDSGLSDWHVVVFPLLAIFITLQLIVFIGEAVREAFDPKVFSRLR